MHVAAPWRPRRTASSPQRGKSNYLVRAVVPFELDPLHSAVSQRLPLLRHGGEEWESRGWDLGAETSSHEVLDAKIAQSGKSFAESPDLLRSCSHTETSSLMLHCMVYCRRQGRKGNFSQLHRLHPKKNMTFHSLSPGSVPNN